MPQVQQGNALTPALGGEHSSVAEREQYQATRRKLADRKRPRLRSQGGDGPEQLFGEMGEQIKAEAAAQVDKEVRIDELREQISTLEASRDSSLDRMDQLLAGLLLFAQYDEDLMVAVREFMKEMAPYLPPDSLAHTMCKLQKRQHNACPREGCEKCTEESDEESDEEESDYESEEEWEVEEREVEGDEEDSDVPVLVISEEKRKVPSLFPTGPNPARR